MKKLFLTLGAASLCLSSFAAQKILYQQNFETAADVDATGWSYNGGSITIASDEYGKFLELSLGQNNGRSGQVLWGQDIYVNELGESVLEDGTYTVQFDFSIKTNSNNQYNTEFALFTNHQAAANNAFRLPWSGTAGPWDNYVFSLLQTNTAADADMTAAIQAPYTKTVNTADDGTETITWDIDKSSPYTISTGSWYTVECKVNTNTREVEYSVTNLDGTELCSGTMTVPEMNQNGDENPISMFVEGMYILTARYQTTILLDNFMISFESSQEVANEPTVALTAVGKDADDNLNLNLRTYTITFLSEETLHVLGTDGKETTVDYADCDGAYQYSTTTSGTLKAWTTSGSATSETVEVEVDCSPVILPAADATITSVEAGYGKTYTLTVSNAEVPLRPTIFINYEFHGVNGESISASGEASGVKVTVHEEGTLTVVTEAFGYQSTSTTVDNNLEFAVKKDYDFARMTQDELTAAGFTTWNEKNSASTSGFDNWTARKRLYYNLAGSETVNDAGETVYTAVYPFGYVSEDGPVLYYSEIGVEGGDLGINVAGYELFEGITVFAGHNVTALLHVGLTNNATSGGNNKNIDVLNLQPTDFVLYNTIGSYGSDSNHPVCATDEEYYAQLEGTNNVVAANTGAANEDGTYTVSCPIYRIDTVCNKLTIFKQEGAEGISDVTIDSKVVNNDPYYYSIDGIRMAEPTQPGIYIHQGKKIYVK